MLLLFPLIVTTLTLRVTARWLSARGFRAAVSWDNWRASAAAGMAAVFICTGVTHFTEPQRTGLIAVVPDFVPAPAFAVTVTGLLEFVLAVGLLTPRTRRLAAGCSVILLILLFPANLVAAAGVGHPAAPSTPLVPRALLQLTFITFSAAALFKQTPGTGEPTARAQPVPLRRRAHRLEAKK